MTERIFLHYTK